MVDFLIRAGADTSATDTYGQDALILATKGGNKFAVDRLLKEPNVNTSQTDIDGNTALIHACVNEDRDMIEILVKRGFDVLKQDGTGVPPLLWLIRHKCSYDVIEYLISNTSALNSRDKNGRDAEWYVEYYAEGDPRLRSLLESDR